MKTSGLNNSDDFGDLLEQGRGPYDPDPDDNQDLWFLPDRVPDAAESDPFAPLPRADNRPLFEPAQWRRAQDALSGPLAELTLDLGRLSVRMAQAGDGLRQRLAIAEISDLSWWSGDRIAPDRLALWVGLRMGASGEDAQALTRAGWAVRRLCAGLAPSQGGWRVGVEAFLGRQASDGETPESIADLAGVMAEMGGLHPVTQAAVLFHVWRMAGKGPARDLEAAVMAARHAGTLMRGQGLFMPLALSGPTALRASGSAQARLGAWLAGVGQAVTAALLLLERLEDWHSQALSSVADLSGKTPKSLVGTLRDWPMVSAPLAETQTGASRAAVQRNLDLLKARGLIREITGQGRYRLWSAAL